MKVRRLVASATLAAIFTVPTTAYAGQATLYSTTTGASSWNFDSSSTLFSDNGVKIKDTAADSHSVYVLFKTWDGSSYSPEMRTQNYGGYNTTKTVGPYQDTDIYYHQGCVDIQWSPDRCGSVRYPERTN